jgi:hypothetical protein
MFVGRDISPEERERADALFTGGEARAAPVVAPVRCLLAPCSALLCFMPPRAMCRMHARS